MEKTLSKMLIIEDDEFIADLYKIQFTSENIAVDLAKNATDGLKLAQANHYDIILLDVMLPDMNGIEVLKQLKADDRTKTMPVALCSNMGQESIMKEGLALGAAAYLIKADYTPDTFSAAIRSLVQKPPTTPPQG